MRMSKRERGRERKRERERENAKIIYVLYFIKNKIIDFLIFSSNFIKYLCYIKYKKIN